MNDCVNVEMREALPDLLSGRLAEIDRATLQSHIESCPDCAAELELLRAARASAPLAPSMNAARIASAIAPYAGESLVSHRTARASLVSRFGTMRIAAAAAVIVAAGWAITGPGREMLRGPETQVAEAPSGAPVAAPRTDVIISRPAIGVPANPAQQQAGGAATSRVASLSFVGGTQDLSDADLEKLVSELDGIDVVPSAEPQSVTTAADDIGVDQ